MSRASAITLTVILSVAEIAQSAASDLGMVLDESPASGYPGPVVDCESHGGPDSGNEAREVQGTRPRGLEKVPFAPMEAAFR